MTAAVHVHNHRANITDEEHALLRSLQAKPDIAWPTVTLFCGGWAIGILLGVLTLELQVLPFWVGAVLSGITGYFLFSPIHDAIHRSVSKHAWLNDLVALATVNVLLPYASYKMLRWGHMQHHRFTNEVGKDPDAILTHAWHAPLTLWPFFEVFYLPLYWKHRHERPRVEMVQVMAQFVLGLALLAAVAWVMGPVYLAYWFVASRITLWLIVAVFVFLPHQPHTILQKDRPFQASLLRQGYEWLLTPVMAYQNWHLVHHLYPTVPFYRYKKAWLAREKFHEAQKPARVRAFQLVPDQQI